MRATTSSTELPEVTVIIPTTCETKRWTALNRAIQSVQEQANVQASLIVVVNGNRFDPVKYQELRNMPGLTVVYQDEGSLPRAIKFGRSLVTKPFFAFLDDDDEYLPEALSHRLGPLLADHQVDFVASNGFRSIHGRDRTMVTAIESIQMDPLYALCTENWLASCGGLYRSSSVPLQYFDGETAYLEWTFLAYKLASTRTMKFVNVPTFRVYDTEDSLSKSSGYQKAEIVVLPKILDLTLPPKVRRAVREKMGRAQHHMANDSHKRGNMSEAWRHHLVSLCYPGGLKYLLYSRKLIWNSIRRQNSPH